MKGVILSDDVWFPTHWKCTHFGLQDVSASVARTSPELRRAEVATRAAARGCGGPASSKRTTWYILMNSVNSKTIHHEQDLNLRGRSHKISEAIDSSLTH